METMKAIWDAYTGPQPKPGKYADWAERYPHKAANRKKLEDMRAEIQNAGN